MTRLDLAIAAINLIFIAWICLNGFFGTAIGASSCERYRIGVLRGYVASIDMVDDEWWCHFIALGLATTVLALGSHSVLAARSLGICIDDACGFSFWCISITEVNLPGKRHAKIVK